ncbi:wd40 repeat-containing protein [Stylonychia lemnae]|uniref:Wd40 repeat-containing protein n=1 Tax=Stylonychia lemnae TaxID=5949 RepID=A0A078B1T3_STYLE|nr:wd40 repeat-containing protein [Stylonychia lemnae]|eukprot:CDW88520.1 wd40 repeat-containing protein [Stylonychia lemnae]
MADQQMSDDAAEILQQPQRHPFKILLSNEVSTCVRFSPIQQESTLMCTSNLTGSLKLFRMTNENIQNGFISNDKLELVHEFKDHLFPINDINFSTYSSSLQNPYLASCSDDTLINMYDLTKQALVRCFIGHQSYVTKIKFNNVTNVLLSCGTDNKLIMWDIRSNKAIFKILGHPEPITSIDMSFDNTMISSSSYDGFVRLWDMFKGTCLKTMVAESGSDSPIGLCKMTPNSKYLLFANLNSKIGLYNYKNDIVKQYIGHSNEQYCLDGLFVKNKQNDKMVLLYGGEDSRLSGWDLNSQDVIISANLDVENKGMLVNSVDYDVNNELVAASGNFKGVYIDQLHNLIKQ